MVCCRFGRSMRALSNIARSWRSSRLSYLLLCLLLLGTGMVLHRVHIHGEGEPPLKPGYRRSVSESVSDGRLLGFQKVDLSGFDVRKANLKFLPQFKNPCWLEPYTGKNVYSKNKFSSNLSYPKKIDLVSSYKYLPQGGIPLTNDEICTNGACRIRCLPYFMLLGVHKSGTTDICNRITMHPQVFSSIKKEVYWWNQLRFKELLGASVGDYADLFDKSVSELVKYRVRDGENSHYYPAILGEFTAMTYFDMSHWREDPDNAGLPEPVRTTAFDVFKLNPDIKLMVSLRNPTSRLYSHYNLFHGQGTPADFHKRVEGSIWWWKHCISMLPVRNCGYGSPPGMPPVYDKVGDPRAWWKTTANYSGELRTGMYAMHAREWLKVFPRQSILFIHMEEYSANVTKSFNEQIFPFLGIHSLNEQNIKTISDKTPSFQRHYQPMLEKTKLLLDQFYRPFNEELAELLGDKKWLWDT